jgi:hypothetical protein
VDLRHDGRKGLGQNRRDHETENPAQDERFDEIHPLAEVELIKREQENESGERVHRSGNLPSSTKLIISNRVLHGMASFAVK